MRKTYGTTGSRDPVNRLFRTPETVYIYRKNSQTRDENASETTGTNDGDVRDLLIIIIRCFDENPLAHTAHTRRLYKHDRFSKERGGGCGRDDVHRQCTGWFFVQNKFPKSQQFDLVHSRFILIVFGQLWYRSGGYICRRITHLIDKRPN